MNKTVVTQVAMLQTLPTEEGKETVPSMTLKDGSNVKCPIKSPRADTLDGATKEGISKEKAPSWGEMSQLRTAFNIGENPLPPGVVQRLPTDAR